MSMLDCVSMFVFWFGLLSFVGVESIGNWLEGRGGGLIEEIDVEDGFG